MHTAITEFLLKAQHVRTDTAIQTLCEHEITFLYQTFAATTVHKLVSQYRNAIREANLVPAFLVHMHERQDVAKTRRTTYAESLGTRHRQLYPITNVDTLIARAVECLTAHSYTRLIVGLELLTGRRPYEVAVTAHFEMIDEHYVWFQGQAKTRGTVPTSHRYAIPTLIPVNDVCTALARLRHVRSFAGYTAHRFDDTAGKTLRDTRRSVFGAFLPDGALQVKEALRKVYACVAYDWFARADISFNAYIADVLGHGHNDVNTANSYQDFYLAELK